MFKNAEDLKAGDVVEFFGEKVTVEFTEFEIYEGLDYTRITFADGKGRLSVPTYDSIKVF